MLRLLVLAMPAWLGACSAATISDPPRLPATRPAAAVAAADEDEHSAHHVALYLGRGVEDRDGEPTDKGLAVGVQYEYRFADDWGVGGAFETLGGDTVREVVFAAPVSYHPGGGPWRLFGGPGFEITEEKDKWLFRLGVGYEFGLAGGWSLAPELLIDLIETGENIWVLGLAIGKGF